MGAGATIALVTLVPLVLSSCGLLRSAAETSGRAAQAVLPEPALLRYADLVLIRVDEGIEEFAATEVTHEAQLQATRWRLDFLRWTTQITIGPNALTGMLDLLVMVTAQRWMYEDYWIPDVWGESARPILAALELSEANGWDLVEDYLEPEQIEGARELLALWREENPHFERDSLVAFPSFRMLAKREEASPGISSLFGALGFDPLSGLEPATREVELARQFGQRALFYLQRAPRILSSELELRLHDAHTEITAAVEDLSAELTTQRERLVEDLEAAKEPVSELLEEARATLAVGEEAAGEVTETIEALDDFVAGFREDDAAAGAGAGAAEETGVPVAGPVEASVREVAPEGEPFDVTEYGSAAERIGDAANDLTTLLVELDERLPGARALLDETVDRGVATIDRATRNLLVVGLVLIVAAAIAVLLVRRLSWRAA